MLTLLIDIECETRDEFEDKSEEVQQIKEHCFYIMKHYGELREEHGI